MLGIVKTLECTTLRHCSCRGYNFYNFWKLEESAKC